MIHSEDKEGIIIADKLTRVAVDRRMHVYALHHCWLPSLVRRQIENFSNRDSAIVIHVILSPPLPSVAISIARYFVVLSTDVSRMIATSVCRRLFYDLPRSITSITPIPYLPTQVAPPARALRPMSPLKPPSLPPLDSIHSTHHPHEFARLFFIRSYRR